MNAKPRAIPVEADRGSPAFKFGNRRVTFGFAPACFLPHPEGEITQEMVCGPSPRLIFTGDSFRLHALMLLFENRQFCGPGLDPLPHRRWILALGFAVSALVSFWIVSARAQDESSHPSRHWRIEIQAPDAQGSLPAGSRLTLFLRVSREAQARQENLVALVEGPSFPRRLYPLVPDGPQGVLSTTVEVEAAPSGAMSAAPKAMPVSVVIARIQGTELLRMGKHTVYVTLSAPIAGEPPSESASVPPRSRPAGLRGEPATQIALADEAVQEEDLLHPSPLNGGHAYWKRVNDRIGRSLRKRLSAQPPSRTRRNPAVGFRLFANGEAQLIHLERSSDDPRIDESAMLAVIDAHPFPPFPADAAETYLDVHVVLPVLAP
jgi:hypothetical protein